MVSIVVPLQGDAVIYEDATRMIQHISRATMATINLESTRWSHVLRFSRPALGHKRALSLFVHQASGTLRPRSQVFVIMNVSGSVASFDSDEGIGFCFTDDVQLPMPAACLTKTMESEPGLQMLHMITGTELARKLAKQSPALEWEVHVIKHTPLTMMSSQLEEVILDFGKWNPKSAKADVDQDDQPELVLAIESASAAEKPGSKPLRRIFGKQPMPKADANAEPDFKKHKSNDGNYGDVGGVNFDESDQSDGEFVNDTGMFEDLLAKMKGFDFGLFPKSSVDGASDDNDEGDEEAAVIPPELASSDTEHEPVQANIGLEQEPDQEDLESVAGSEKEAYAARQKTTDMELVRDALGARPAACVWYFRSRLEF